jgi:hypothetical protein
MLGGHEPELEIRGAGKPPGPLVLIIVELVLVLGF